MKMMPNTASQRRRLDAGFHSNFTQLYGVNWKAMRFILPLKEEESELIKTHNSDSFLCKMLVNKILRA